MIEIKDIQEIACQLYDPEGNLIGVIDTELQLNDVRLQIKTQSLEGYYCLFNSLNGGQYRIDFDKNGRVDFWPDGFFDTSMKQCMDLL